MKKEILTINNKKYYIPHYVTYTMIEYINEENVKKLENKKNELLADIYDLKYDYDKLPLFEIKNKFVIKQKILNIRNMIDQLKYQKVTKLPNIEQIKKTDEKYKYLNQLLIIFANTLGTMKEDTEYITDDISKLMTYYFSIINTDMNLAQKNYNDKLYDKSIQKLYKCLEKCFLIDNILKAENRGKSFIYDNFINDKKQRKL